MSTERDWEFLAIGPSDVVRVIVFGHAELSTSPEGQRVDPQGNLHLPMVGAYSAKGKSVERINTELAELYGKYMKQPNVTAEVVQYTSRGFYALGQFETPGFKVLERPVNALEATSLSGQLLRGADRETVYLLRPHDDRMEVHEFNMKRPGPAAMVMVQPGDVLYVRQTGYEDFQEDILPILAGLGYPAFQMSVTTFGE